MKIPFQIIMWMIGIAAIIGCEKTNTVVLQDIKLSEMGLGPQNKEAVFREIARGLAPGKLGPEFIVWEGICETKHLDSTPKLYMVLSIPRKALEITEIPADGKIRINGFLPSDLPIPPFVRLEMAVNKAAQDISRRSITLDCGILAENLFVTSRIKYNDTFGIKLAKEVQEGAAISTCRGTAQISLTLPLKENGETGRQILAKYGLALDIAGQLVSKWKFWWEEMEIPSSQPSK